MIRHAVHDDIPRLIPLVMAFMAGVEELTAAGLVPDSDTIEFLLEDCIDSETCGVLLAEVDGEIVGGIFGAVVPWMFNAEIRCLQELGWFIPKEQREKYPMAAMGLWKRFRQWGKEQGATVFCMVSTVREESPRVRQMYAKAGLVPIETKFIGRL